MNNIYNNFTSRAAILFCKLYKTRSHKVKLPAARKEKKIHSFASVLIRDNNYCISIRVLFNLLLLS